MKKYYATLSEKDRRRYAAIESLKLGHGGQSYIAGLLGCSEKTVSRGLDELESMPEQPEYEAAQRKPGGGRHRYDENHPDIDAQFIESGVLNPRTLYRKARSFPMNLASEGDVLFGLGPDRAVWAKICDHPDELPLAENAPGNPSAALRLGSGEGRSGQVTALVWRMLTEAEETFGAKSMARERAACGGWPTPRSVADFLMWLEDEVEIQQQQSAGHPNEMTERLAYAAALSELAAELRGLGFEPSTPPWETEALQEGEA
ncbi:MAG: hypothetical protein AB1894_11510 [Chloroflexota bacterium]